MRLLSVRLIISLIVGITLVSSGFSYYEVLTEKRALRNDVERRDEILGESLVGNVERFWRAGPENFKVTRLKPASMELRTRSSNAWCSVLATASTFWA